MSDFTHHLIFYSAPTATPAVAAEHAFRTAGAVHELPALPEQLSRFNTVYGQRFAAGHEAVLLESDSVLLFIAWLAFHRLRIDELARTWELPPDEAVVYDVFTMPEARGRGLYPAALTWTKGMLASRGISTCWIYAERENTASLRGIGKAGFEQRGTMRSLLIGNAALRSGRVEGARL